MNTRSLNDGSLVGNLWLRSTVAVAVALFMALPLAGLGAVPTPVVNLKFTESVGAFAVGNTGSLGGDAFFHQGDGTGYPELVELVPQGLFAPAINARSLDMGMIDEGQGDRALDLVTDLGPLGTLGAFPNGFTLTGWINARTLSAGGGGNRILFALEVSNGPGFDLVQLSDGSLQLGVNQWPDGSPARSSAGMVTADAELGAGNWVFFAVTYDHVLEVGQVNFYFGKGDTLAGLDVNRTYPRGPVEYTGELTLGNFGIVTGGLRGELGPNGPSRVFRGLIDEVKVFDSVLDLEQIQQVQVEGTVPTVPATITRQPESQTVFAGRTARFDVVASGSAPITYQWQTNGVDVAGATDSVFILPDTTTAHDGLEVQVLVSNVGVTDLASEIVTLNVIEGTGQLVSVSFSDLINRGDLGGNGTLVATDGYPDFSAAVPVGPQAPAGNTVSMDFGAIAEGQGGRAIDFNNLQYGGTMGPLDEFTITGWLNARDLAVGAGGNRITFALASANGLGFDLVHLANGALQVGVNQWPDGVPQSEPGLVTEDPDVGAANWVFFAVTYSGLATVDNLNFYRGDPNQAAAAWPDSVRTYDQGPIVTSGPLTLGNFGPVGVWRNHTGDNGSVAGQQGSRVFRGLMDEVQVFNRVLTIEEIREAQVTAVVQPGDPVAITQQPQNVTAFEGQTARFTVAFEGTPPFSVQWQRNDQDIPGATGATYAPVVSVADSGAQFRAVIGNDHGPDQISEPATLTVLAESGHKVWVSFSEDVPPFVNIGNLGGAGVVVAADDFPVVSANVPVGPQAPTGNTQSVDFGTIIDGQGGRAIDFDLLYGGTMGQLAQFTITAWVNVRDLTVGPGGNRIAIALASGNGPGFDLVHLADGSLRLGVNQWPDGADGGGPISSPGLITADPDAGAANWVFVAVTYDGTTTIENANFYRGTADQAAALDVVRDYNRGPIVTSGPLTLGNFSTVTSNAARNETGVQSRVLRGLMDEIQVFSRVLSLAEIQEAQSAAVPVVVDGPRINIMVEQGNVVFSWEATSTFELLVRDNLTTGDWTPVGVAPTVVGNQYTVTLPLEAGVRFFRLRNP
jgi:hypothetical protein